MNSLRWIVSQIGARQHYGVARGFHFQGDLRAFYTDSWCRWGSFILKHGPGRLRAFAGRYHSDLAAEQVIARTFVTEFERLRYRPVSHSTDAIYREYLRGGEAFGRWVARDLERREIDPARDAFFGFNTGCLETVNLLRQRGVLTIVDQIDPGRVEEELVWQETQRWPEWQAAKGRIPEAYFARLSAEWEASDLIIVNSEWSRAALIEQKVPKEKLLVVPVAYETSVSRPPKRPVKNGPLTVLWLGTVNLRKGIPYLVGAAKLLKRTDIRFIVAGPMEISREAVDQAPSNISFIGRVTRDQTNALYANADIFVLPTISDGFAITQVEAMAHGLPVITTPNCGDVVTSGLDGLLVGARDERGLAEAIAKLNANRDLLRDMSEQALQKADGFHLPRQAAQIESAVRRYRRQKMAPQATVSENTP